MIVTFGHSTLALEDARGALVDRGVQLLVDVRSHPVSNHVPQWNWEALQDFFGAYYIWLPELGGWSEHVRDQLGKIPYAEFGVDVEAYMGGYFPKNRIGRKVKLAEGQEGWTSQGLHDYAWYMTTPAFRDGMQHLFGLERQYKRVAVFCSEILWWKCHRSQIADALCYTARDLEVFHMQPKWANHLPHAVRRWPRYNLAIRDIWSDWWHV